MRRGQTPGTVLDVNASFGQYQDEGQGRVRKINTHPVAFINVSPSAAGPGASQPGQNLPSEVGDKALDHLVAGLLEGRKQSSNPRPEDCRHGGSLGTHRPKK